jgi:hypothetical protein
MNSAIRVSCRRRTNNRFVGANDETGPNVLYIVSRGAKASMAQGNKSRVKKCLDAHSSEADRR